MSAVSKDEAVWYFAYGSNMSSKTFRDNRGITPIAELPVRVPGWTLKFDIYGVPYQEPAFASIAPISAPSLSHPQPTTEEEVHGIAYLVTKEQYIRILASEGGDIVYDQAELLAIPTNFDAVGTSGGAFTVRTLVTAFGCTPARFPSLRYKEIMLHGAQEAALPNHYQRHLHHMHYYRQPDTVRHRLGAALFLSFWTPIMMLAEYLTKWTADSDGQGNVPAFTRLFVRSVLISMWYHHDHIHALIWGRGDGLSERSFVGFPDGLKEKERLLAEFYA